MPGLQRRQQPLSFVPGGHAWTFAQQLMFEAVTAVEEEEDLAVVLVAVRSASGLGLIPGAKVDEAVAQGSVAVEGAP